MAGQRRHVLIVEDEHGERSGHRAKSRGRSPAAWNVARPASCGRGSA